MLNNTIVSVKSATGVRFRRSKILLIGVMEMVKIKSGKNETPTEFFDNLTWLSTKDAAIYLRKFRSNGQPAVGAIRTAIWRGTVKARKWQRRLYIKKTDLDRLLQTAPFA